MLMDVGGYLEVISVSQPRYTNHTTPFRDYTLQVKVDHWGTEGAFVHRVIDREGAKVSTPDISRELQISFNERNYVPLSVRLE